SRRRSASSSGRSTAAARRSRSSTPVESRLLDALRPVELRALAGWQRHAAAKLRTRAELQAVTIADRERLQARAQHLGTAVGREEVRAAELARLDVDDFVLDEDA